MKTTQAAACRTTCPYCGVGCGVLAQVEEGELIAVSGDQDHPANRGRLCVKGSALAESQVAEGRLLHPQLQGRRVGWDTALDTVAQRLQDTLSRHGPGSVAFYLSGQLLTEDYYVANKLMKGFVGSANVDTNSRLCMSSAVAGYKRAFGADYVPCSYEDLERCDLLVMVGSNAAWTHPVLYQRVEAARRDNPALRVVVIDPRRTATCELADLHLAIAPGSDGALFAGLLRYLDATGATDAGWIAAHSEGYEAALEAAADLDVAAVAAVAKLPPEAIEAFYREFAATERVVTFYSQGVNQSATGTDKCNAIINCHLATGRIGRLGCGPFSITGQPNAMGGREVGGLANQLAAHMDFRPEHRDIVGRFWEAPVLAPAAGLKAVDLFLAVERGEVRFLWVMATNPAVSLPDSAQVRRALERCDFVVVSDCVSDTDTAQHADLLLPACGWGEKDGTVTNSERCISRQRAFQPAAGEAKPDWWMVAEVARRLGFAAQFDYRSARDIFVEHAALSAFENRGSRDFDIGALAELDQAAYDKLPPTYWPCPAEGAVRGPAQGHFFTDSGKAQFLPTDASAPSLGGRSSGPLRLNTGRLRDQWHTMTRTGRVAKLARHRDFLAVCLNPEDALELGIGEGDLVSLHNELGRVNALARVEPGQAVGQVFCPIHWSDQYAAAGCVSALVPAIADPVSGQPQSKFAAVSASRLPVAAWGLMVSRQRPHLADLPFWSVIPVEGGYLVLLAFADEPGDLEALPAGWLPGVAGRAVVFCDRAAGDQRLAVIEAGRLQGALYVSAVRDNLPQRQWCESQLAASGLDHRVLAGFDSGVEDVGRLVCSCHEVGEKTIVAAIGGGACSVDALGEQLRCGTCCGSCIPELRALLRSADPHIAA